MAIYIDRNIRVASKNETTSSDTTGIKIDTVILRHQTIKTCD